MAAQEVTRLLHDWSNGDRGALDRLMPLVYDELRRIAAGYIRRERPGHTLQPTALVNEAFLRLIDQVDVDWRNRAQFFGIAAQAMRRILVDHARSRRAAKRGAGEAQLEFKDAMEVPGPGRLDLVALDDALNALARFDPDQSRIVELRFFGGLSIEETAEVMNTSASTVKREWSVAKAWLYREMTGSQAGS